MNQNLEDMNDGTFIDNQMIEEPVFDLENTILDSIAMDQASQQQLDQQQLDFQKLQLKTLDQLNLKQLIGMNALDYLNQKSSSQQSPFISSGIKEIDNLLSNGLRTGIITEIYGPDGSCKTSLALQFAFNAIINDQSDQKPYAIYISTTKQPHSQRINQIIEGIKQRNQNLTEQKIKNSMNQFIEELIPTIIRLKDFMEHDLSEYFMKLKRIRLVVIDNIYDLASQVDDFKEKQEFLFRFVNLLKKYAHENNTAVVIVNNVVAQINDNPTSALYPSTSTVIPALGNYWTHLINERLHLSLLNEYVSGTNNKIRCLSVKLSPRLSYNSVKLIPDNFGIQCIN